MSAEKWNVTFVLTRQKADGKPSDNLAGREADSRPSEIPAERGADGKPYNQSFQLEVDPDEYVLDGIERIWAFHDRSLVFRHACHHSTCGACGMRVNGVEKLTCITSIRSVTHDGGTLRVEPLRNFPVVGDLVVDMSDLYLRLEEARFSQVARLDEARRGYEKESTGCDETNRLVDCIECGCCISACPIALTTPAYVGPAVLAAIQESYVQTRNPALLDLADQASGAWRCHSAYECTAVCPSNVDPGWRIMNLRRRIVGDRFRKLLGRR